MKRTLEVQGTGCWDRTLVPTVSEMKSFNDRLNRPSRQTAGVPPFRSSCTQHWGFGSRSGASPSGSRLILENTRISTLPMRKYLRFPCSASSANEKRPKRTTNAPKITFPRGDTSCLPTTGLRSASQPAERRIPLSLSTEPSSGARAYEAGSGATDPSGVSTDAS